MKKILILGGSGLVGTILIKKAVQNYSISATYNKNKIDFDNCKPIKLSIKNDANVVHSLIINESPDVVINTIAISNVDFCEEHKSEADFLHVTVIREIVDACKTIDARLIHLSSDWVFDGKKNGYKENDVTNPINYYGRTRIRAEQIVKKYSDNNVILRPAVIYGWHPNSRFLNFVINNLRSCKEVQAYNDQYSSPTLVDDLADCIIRIIETNAIGLYHTVGSSCVNRFEFAKVIAEKFGFDDSLIKSVESSDVKQIAKRPAISCLDNAKATKEFGFHFCTIEEGVSKVFEQSKIVS